ncbi:UDP-galactose/UDP-glucose transporter 7 [Gracilariopsis chorda]|uniref:UDP-galactose/UDP-glucose transporter 7 n=1 Tax=Gracilariopsis chorda TaxID=448386 RepID=A0A2V3IVU1_9FLOR|nr:UDP-galactose/UDP-glucose transporter 7 [Gracilariopsis chorda]|eukprot:PXF45827.1 UDP-galactose/UDP-glucose transporter 7 [Gracilariopsis chorda]
MTAHVRDDDSKTHRIRLLPEKDDKPDKPGDAPTPEQVRRTIIVSLSVCTFYILISSSMVFTNKALSYTYDFRTTNVLLLFQMFFTIVLLRILRSMNLIEFSDFDLSRAKQVAPVSIFYSLNAAVALVALRELSVPSYTLIKRLAPLFTISLEAILLKKYATRSIIFALLIMASGTVLAANADSSSSTFAWLLGFTSCAFQALYLTFVKRSGIDTGMSSFGILYYHSILSIPCISAIVLAVGEIGPALAYDKWGSPSFLIVFISSLFMGLLLNYALFLCTEFTSPTSTVVSGQVKAMGQTIIGIFTFGGVDLNLRYICGTLLNILGGFMYAYSKLKLIRERG